MIAIIDYGMGNIFSVQNTIEYLGLESKLTANREEIFKAEKIILPGVGSYNKAMSNIRHLGLDGSIREFVLEQNKPILGICLGMQLMGMSSNEDGFTEGLGLIDGEVIRFDADKGIKVPHVGFNKVEFEENGNLFRGLEDSADFYFTHSYRMSSNDSSFNLSYCLHGDKFVAAFEKKNIFGTQFHPEKSQFNGMKVIKNFLEA